MLAEKNCCAIARPDPKPESPPHLAQIPLLDKERGALPRDGKTELIVGAMLLGIGGGFAPTA